MINTDMQPIVAKMKSRLSCSKRDATLILKPSIGEKEL